MEPIIYLHTTEENTLDKVFKDCKGYYLYEEIIVCINLYNSTGKTEDETISDIIDTIAHEYLHYTIWECRAQYGQKWITDYFEEELVATILGHTFDPEDYAELIQIEE